MEWQSEEYIIRYARLREELKPVEIFTSATLEPIRPDWVAICYSRMWNPRWPMGIENFTLYYLLDDGTTLETEQWDTLEIALDQAKAIIGTLHNEWAECRVKVIDSDGQFTWDDITSRNV